MKFAAFATLLFATASVQAQGIPPPSQRADVAGEPTQVLVLASAHLSQMSEPLEPEVLEPLLGRLAAWQPEIITIENISGIGCAQLQDYAEIYEGTADSYCRDTGPARRALGLTPHDAIVAADALWRSWPDQPDAAQRRHLAAVLLAAGEPASALVQWLRLAETERRAGNDLTPELVETLRSLNSSRNESYAIAARLAARLGLERVYPIDDHSADNAVEETPEYAAAIQRIWSGPSGDERREAEAQASAALAASGDIIAYYRWLNAPEYPDLVDASDFGAALADDTEGLPGRKYAAWWETRNLRMVANIRAAVADHPGARALSIVGASHKGYFDDYLGMMHAIRVVDTNAVLAAPDE